MNIGINENINFKSVELRPNAQKNNHSLAITLVDLNKKDVSEDDILDNIFDEVLDEDGYAIVPGSGNARSFLVFPLNVPDVNDFNNNPKSEEVRYKEMVSNMLEMQNMFTHMLSLSHSPSEVGKFEPFRNTGLGKENRYDILTEDMASLISKNLFESFIEKLEPKLENHPAFRLLLVRQGPSKAFPTFRRRFVKENPFMELASIPLEASKLKFTDYEISKGLNSSAPSSQQNTNNKAGGNVKEDEDLNAASVFG